MDIAEFTPIVQRAVNAAGKKLPPHIDKGDLESVANVQLVKLLGALKEDQKHTFKAYLYIRIKGTVIDYIRNQCTQTRANWQKYKKYSKGVTELTHKLNRVPTDKEIQAYFSISGIQYSKLKADIVPYVFKSIDDPIHDDVDTKLGDTIADETTLDNSEDNKIKRLIEICKGVISLLPPRYAELIQRHFLQGETLVSIAHDYKITISRASQIKESALHKLRGYVTAHESF